ncbi:hypothetical protein H7683_18950 [Ectopseudomonas mendocina]|uniref:hypothetical protein n=1 Tax=Ectopseudomonas mendocina TaxID=300 RepID=UPI001ADF1BA2|nr:hypothetical protein [Pseudomonas mendocina]QTN45046.1 hypothetical protein H7683_18950 [Pseudomonas mendocina]
MPANDDDLGLPGAKRKQTSFDITNYPPAQRGLAQAGAAGQPVPGDPARAQRMQAQYDQPVTKGVPLIGQIAGLNESAIQPRQTSFDITNYAPAQRQAGIRPELQTAGGANTVTDTSGSRPLSILDGLDLAPATQQQSGDWYRTGIGADRSGGEIVGRRGANGVMEFTNQAAAPGSASSARAMPPGGMGGIGDGIGGGLSVGEPGDAKMAHDRFERANQERQKMIDISRRGQIGEGGGRVTVVRDSSRSPSLTDMLNDRQDARRANTEATREGSRQNILSGMDERLTGQLQRQLLGHEIQAAEQSNKRQLALGGILAGLDDPSLQGEARTSAERNYLLQADPKAFMSHQAKSANANGDALKMTEQQSKDLGYYTRGNEANAQLASQGDALTGRATGERGRLRGLTDTVIRGTPWVGDSSLANSMVSQERQQAEQSGREVLSAILRKDTGAAITNQEMEIYGKMYLPQAGDSDQVLNQKAEARTRALESIRGGLGTAERKAAPLRDGQRNSASGPARINDDAGYNALPSGSLFIAPDGSTRRKP